MGSNFFIIPFKSHSHESDFICKDGELEYADGVKLIDGEGQIRENIGSSGEGERRTKPPVPDISFALVRDIVPGWHNHPDNYPVKTLAASSPSMEYWNGLIPQLLAQFSSEANYAGRFVSPFRVIAVWKTKRGEYLSATEPVTLIPNSRVPLVATEGDITEKEVTFRIAAAVCGLKIKMKAPELLRDFVGIIESLEIFVSEPLQKYDLYHAFLPARNVTTDAWCESLDLTTGKIERRRICEDVLSLAWRANMRDVVNDADSSEDLKFYRFASIPLGEVDRATDWCEADKVGGTVFGVLGKQYPYAEISGEGVKSEKSVTVTLKGTGGDFKVETRPLKLSNGGSFKRVMRVYLRGLCSPEKITLRVLGSRDMLHWTPMAVRKGGIVVSLPEIYMRFYKVVVEGELEENEDLQGVVFFKY
ncbi:MAG: hypothetical protein J1F16_05815 [Muribaculaceae bacterium]|nr:hypothetical protein [Muribaculaceae bacterium]